MKDQILEKFMEAMEIVRSLTWEWHGDIDAADLQPLIFRWFDCMDIYSNLKGGARV